ncbi:hypothetical protein M9435_003430 [Picochlorum sp. BPE23]|nr:hypothetical protein M9435_003430 [Picochlorum sp. BPE23]
MVGTSHRLRGRLSEHDFEPFLLCGDDATNSGTTDIIGTRESSEIDTHHHESDESKEGILERVVRHVWHGRVPCSHVKARRYHGGMTNVVFKLWIDSSFHYDTIEEQKAVIARVRQGSDSLGKLLFDTDMEEAVFSMASRVGIGPQCFVQYDNGRVEEFLEGEVVNDGMERIAVPVAQALARWHAVMTDAFYSDSSDHTYTSKTIWERLHRWVAYLRSAIDYGGADWVEALLEAASTCPEQMYRDGGYDRTLCTALIHGDLQCGNILYAGTRAKLIDYDYSTFGEVYFDIGNHFCEYAADYHTNPRRALFDWDRIPSEDACREFCQAYWDTLCTDYPSSSITTSLSSSHNDTVESLVTMSRKYMSLSHLFWSVWGLVMHYSRYSNVDFEYKTYAKDRYDQWKASVENKIS